MLVLTQQVRRPAIGTKTENPVSAGGTVILDSIPDSTLSNKWIVTLSDAVDENVMTYEVLAVNKFGNNLSHTVYARLGDVVPHTLDIGYNTGAIEISATNTGVNDILINIVRVETIG